MAHLEVDRAKDVARRFGNSLRTAVQRVTENPLVQAGGAAVTSRARVKGLLRLGDRAPVPQPTPSVAPGQQIIPLMDITNKPTIPMGTVASQPVISLANIKRSIGRATVPCENHEACGGTIELALHEHNANNSEVGETSVIDATMVNKTCECDLTDEERERVLDRVQREIRTRG